MTAVYRGIGSESDEELVSPRAARPSSIWRRPTTWRSRRLVPVALGLLFLVGCSAWLFDLGVGVGSSARAARAARTQAEQYLAKNRATPFGGHTDRNFKTEHGEISPAAVLYEQDPSRVIPYDALIRYAQQGSDGHKYPPAFIADAANRAARAKAGFIVLVRNSELPALLNSMRDVEFRFNRKYNYPWIFLNDADFTEEFKAGVRTITRAEIRFGKIPSEHWGYPAWIDQAKAAADRATMEQKDPGTPYALSESYRHMCRFQSGFFFRHPLTLDLDYYWRVEPGIQLTCDVDYDPFLFMQMNNKTYGFAMAVREIPQTIPTLWDTTKAFFQQNPEYVAKDSARGFVIDDNAVPLAESSYNLCHMWDNLELVDLSFFRSKPYLDYFDNLDKSGGFFYERWGDAPVHSIAASLMLNRSQIHHFDDFGYLHPPWQHCPSDRAKYHDNGKCSCNPSLSIDEESQSCLPTWWQTLKAGPSTADPIH